MPFKISVKTILLYAAYAALCVFLNCVLDGTPLSLGLCFGMLLCGTNVIAVPVIFVLSSTICLDLITSAIFAFMGLFLGLIVFFYRRSGKKIKYEAIIYLIIALAPYVVFGKWTGGEFFTDNPYVLRSVASVIVLAFSFFAFKSVYALLFRLERCRLREDEFVCIAVAYAVCGAGASTLIGEPAYVCFTAFVTVLSVRLIRSPFAVIVALVTAVPCAVSSASLDPMTANIVICTLALLFSGAGRFACGGVTGTATALYMYLEKYFECAVPLIVAYALMLFIAVFSPCLPSDSKLKEIKRRLLVTEVLPQTAVARAKMNTGERLYRISEVFREIECAFIALDENPDDSAAKARMLEDLREKCCKNCERAKRCELSNVYAGFKRLIDSGCVKGKVNIIDLPSEMTANCSHPADVLTRLNGLLAEYRRYAVESENARAGRVMLAEQARGVAEVMKDCAVELSRVSSFDGAAATAKVALAANGICCPEVYADGENAGELCAVVIGKPNVKAMRAIISDALGRKYVLKDKIVYDGKKCCLVFSAPPKYDAAFGVAYAIKSGESVSGDTHSVVRVNERSFLMALSDGMGSGEYARKVSEAAISLIEAFYRAEMPADTILKTINKLLSFNRDERFTCIDIAAIDLGTGRADFVKIGSPVGIIVREGEIKVLESTSLPLGILDNLHPTTCTEILRAGDIVVFMSDGITSAFGSATDLYEFLQDLKPLNPQSLADKILAGALDKTEHKVTDDMTVLCTRIF